MVPPGVFQGPPIRQGMGMQNPMAQQQMAGLLMRLIAQTMQRGRGF